MHLAQSTRPGNTVRYAGASSENYSVIDSTMPLKLNLGPLLYITSTVIKLFGLNPHWCIFLLSSFTNFPFIAINKSFGCKLDLPIIFFLNQRTVLQGFKLIFLGSLSSNFSVASVPLNFFPIIIFQFIIQNQLLFNQMAKSNLFCEGIWKLLIEWASLFLLQFVDKQFQITKTFRCKVYNQFDLIFIQNALIKVSTYLIFGYVKHDKKFIFQFINIKREKYQKWHFYCSYHFSSVVLTQIYPHYDICSLLCRKEQYFSSLTSSENQKFFSPFFFPVIVILVLQYPRLWAGFVSYLHTGQVHSSTSLPMLNYPYPLFIKVDLLYALHLGFLQTASRFSPLSTSRCSGTFFENQKLTFFLKLLNVNCTPLFEDINQAFIVSFLTIPYQ